MLLTAKNADTLLRGLKAMPGDMTVTGTSGLAVAAVRWKSASGPGSLIGQFLKFAYNNRKQAFIHDSFKIAAWVIKHYGSYKDDPTLKSKASPIMNAIFRNAGGDYKFTFADFKKIHGRDGRLVHRSAMLLVCLSSSLRNDEGGGNVTVIRNISSTMSMRELYSKATQAFGGQGGGSGNHVPYAEMDDI